jgi:hypothetical protein
MTTIILLGAAVAPFLLLAAVFRGGWRAWRARAALKRSIKVFE